MADRGDVDRKIDAASTTEELHEWAEQLAVPQFDYLGAPIEAMLDAEDPGPTEATRPAAESRFAVPPLAIGRQTEALGFTRATAIIDGWSL